MSAHGENDFYFVTLLKSMKAMEIPITAKLIFSTGYNALLVDASMGLRA
jgi:hypothetical protein